MHKNSDQNLNLISKAGLVWILSCLLLLQPDLVAAEDLLIDLASEAKDLGLELDEADNSVAKPVAQETPVVRPSTFNQPPAQTNLPKAQTPQKIEEVPTAKASFSGKAWDYGDENGPLNWADLQPENQLCKTGKMQSPVSILGRSSVGTQGMPSLDIAYREVPLRLKKTTQNLIGEYPLGSFVELGGQRFEFTHYQFKTPSEHLIDGFAYPMEIQLFHKDSDQNGLVISLLVMEGEANEHLQLILNSVPKEKDKLVVYEKTKFNPAVFIPKERSFYRYLGSYSEPPCTENVIHLVFKTPIYASVTQLIIANRLLGDNVRPVQPLNGRLVMKSWLDKSTGSGAQNPATRSGYYFEY